MALWRTPAPLNTETAKFTLPGQWLYYVIGIMGGLIAIFLWYASVLQSNANLNHVIELQAEHIANDIKIQFELRISALKRVAKHLQDIPQLTQASWQTTAEEFMSNYNEFKAVALVSPALKPLYFRTNDGAAFDDVYASLLSDYATKIANTRYTQQWMSPPIMNQAGQRNIFLTVPLLDAKNHLRGYIIGLVDIKTAMNLRTIQDYAISIYIDDEFLFSNVQDLSHNTLTTKIASFDLFDAACKIYIRPTEHLVSVIKTDLPNIALVLGICIVILFILTTHLAQLARHRAKSLDDINHDLTIQISERMRAEDSKQKLEIQLLQGQKLQAIGTLAGGIAHDFNNILYAITGYVEMAREDLTEDSMVYSNLGKVLEASLRGKELISRILTFSRRQHHLSKPIAIKPTIESVLALLKPTIPASVAIDCIDELRDDFIIMGDQTSMHQIIVNVINNAVDAMDGEGTVTMHLNELAADDALLQQFPHRRPGSYCKIEIRDTGHGMDQNTLARIFEPFFTTKEVGKGTGLGLATVHSTVQEHQGEILVASQLGAGATFTILLPEHSTGESSHGENLTG